MPGEATIRPYAPSDRDAVREIACDTAERGEPGNGFYPDRELVSDLLTRYYTDYEPESSWVAESESRLIGYLNGCLDTRRCLKIMIRQIVPRAVLKAIARGALAQKETWMLLRAGLRLAARGGFERGVDLNEYPAHLHVNIRQGFRGKKVGERLMARFLSQAEAAEVRGVHLSVREDNRTGQKFFERLGFRPLNRYAIIQLQDGAHGIGFAVIYGKLL